MQSHREVLFERLTRQSHWNSVQRFIETSAEARARFYGSPWESMERAAGEV